MFCGCGKNKTSSPSTPPNVAIESQPQPSPAAAELTERQLVNSVRPLAPPASCIARIKVDDDGKAGKIEQTVADINIKNGLLFQDDNIVVRSRLDEDGQVCQLGQHSKHGQPVRYRQSSNDGRQERSPVKDELRTKSAGTEVANLRLSNQQHVPPTSVKVRTPLVQSVNKNWQKVTDRIEQELISKVFTDLSSCKSLVSDIPNIRQNAVTPKARRLNNDVEPKPIGDPNGKLKTVLSHKSQVAEVGDMLNNVRQNTVTPTRRRLNNNVERKPIEDPNVRLNGRYVRDIPHKPGRSEHLAQGEYPRTVARKINVNNTRRRHSESYVHAATDDYGEKCEPPVYIHDHSVVRKQSDSFVAHEKIRQDEVQRHHGGREDVIKRRTKVDRVDRDVPVPQKKDNTTLEEAVQIICDARHRRSLNHEHHNSRVVADSSIGGYQLQMRPPSNTGMNLTNHKLKHSAMTPKRSIPNVTWMTPRQNVTSLDSKHHVINDNMQACCEAEDKYYIAGSSHMLTVRQTGVNVTSPHSRHMQPRDAETCRHVDTKSVTPSHFKYHDVNHSEIRRHVDAKSVTPSHFKCHDVNHSETRRRVDAKSVTPSHSKYHDVNHSETRLHFDTKSITPSHSKYHDVIYSETRRHVDTKSITPSHSNYHDQIHSETRLHVGDKSLHSQSPLCLLIAPTSGTQRTLRSVRPTHFEHIGRQRYKVESILSFAQY